MFLPNPNGCMSFRAPLHGRRSRDRADQQELQAADQSLETPWTLVCTSKWMAFRGTHLHGFRGVIVHGSRETSECAPPSGWGSEESAHSAAAGSQRWSPWGSSALSR
eukprot:1158831-Pelagomonas_calceolata.AAC.5